jgi:hypothetical protein
LSVAALLSACEPDGGESTTPGIDASPVTATSDSAAPGSPEAAVTQPLVDSGVGQPITATPEAGGITLGGRDAGSSTDAAGPIVITIPTRSVACGASECTTTNNKTCCEAWSRATGFAGSPQCVTKAQCESDHVIFGSEANRAVESDCDEPSDCSGGQVCCFVRYGMPVTADLFSTEIVGPGASRLCVDLASCNAGAMSITGVAGIPVGVVSCKTAADCKDGTSCMPEASNSATTGKTNAARPGVMVCR